MHILEKIIHPWSCCISVFSQFKKHHVHGASSLLLEVCGKLLNLISNRELSLKHNFFSIHQIDKSKFFYGIKEDTS